jgi:hypothetical protein
MGFVTQFFIKPRKTDLVEFPKGSFTVDGRGKVLTSTLPRKFVTQHVQAIASAVLAAQKLARQGIFPFDRTGHFLWRPQTRRPRHARGRHRFLERQSDIAQPPAKVG